MISVLSYPALYLGMYLSLASVFKLSCKLSMGDPNKIFECGIVVCKLKRTPRLMAYPPLGLAHVQVWFRGVFIPSLPRLPQH